MAENKNSRVSSAQFFVAGELCRRNLVSVVTMGNTPNTDILCSNSEGTKFLYIQVKTFRLLMAELLLESRQKKLWKDIFLGISWNTAS
jgi:hypothetical protein